MKRSILFFLTLILALMVGCSSQKVDEYAVINFVLGEVTLNNSPVQIGQIIKEQDALKTGIDSFCDIKIGGSIIRIKEKTTLTISSLKRANNSEKTELGLGLGKMLCKPKKLLKDDSFVVKTPTAVAGVRGTQFTVEADIAQTTRIKVFHGSVKIAKRVKQFEGKTDTILNAAPVVMKEQKVVITQKEVNAAEKKVAAVIKKEGSIDSDAVLHKVLEKSRKVFMVDKKDIHKFAATDFSNEGQEIVQFKEKPKAVVARIEKVIKQEKELPKPDGRLLITKFEVYFIKKGKVKWEGKVVGQPISFKGKVYIASGEYVFCASTEGPVLWRKNIINNGSLKLEKGALVISTKGTVHRLDPETGQKL